MPIFEAKYTVAFPAKNKKEAQKIGLEIARELAKAEYKITTDSVSKVPELKA